MVDARAIRDVIKAEPSLDFALQTDEEIAAALNAVDQPGDVPGREIKVYLNRSDSWANILIAAEASGASQKLALRIREVLADPDSMLTMTDPDVAGWMAVAVTTSLITDDQRTAILAMGKNRRSLAQIHSLGWIKIGHVIAARDVI